MVSPKGGFAALSSGSYFGSSDVRGDEHLDARHVVRGECVCLVPRVGSWPAPRGQRALCRSSPAHGASGGSVVAAPAHWALWWVCVACRHQPNWAAGGKGLQPYRYRIVGACVAAALRTLVFLRTRALASSNPCRSRRGVVGVVWRGEAHRTARAGIVGASPWGMCRSAPWSSPRHASTGNRAARGTAFLARIPRGSQNASGGSAHSPPDPELSSPPSPNEDLAAIGLVPRTRQQR